MLAIVSAHVITSVGERLGPFLLLERIGRGGMGEVWLAQPVSIPGVHDLCVVKTVRAEQADDPDAVRRFADESRLAMLLNHPHISRVVDAGRAGDVRYLALELVEGVDLLNLLKRLAERGRLLDERIALWIGACVLDALSFAHGAKHPITKTPLGVVHRDISPQNIMCGKNGDAHVIDFGLALSSVKQAKTEQDVVLGKLSYMAPEQARAGAVDQRTDIYATGVVLYEIIAGRRYWGDLEHRQIWMKAGYEDWVPPHWRELPPDIAAFLAPMVARDVKRRSTDAAERLESLMPLLMSRGGAGDASRRLGELVRELALPELERADRARATARTSGVHKAANISLGSSSASLPPNDDDAPTEGIVQPFVNSSLPPLTPVPDHEPEYDVAQLPADTQSIALDEAVAIAAALATRTTAMPIVNPFPSDWQKTVPTTEVRRASLRPSAATEPMDEMEPRDRSATSSAAPAALLSPPTMPFMMRATQANAPPSRAPIFIGALLVLGLAGVVVGALVVTQRDRASHIVDAGTRLVTPVVVEKVVDAGARVAVATAPHDAGVVRVDGVLDGVLDAGVDSVVDAGAAPPPTPIKKSPDDRLRSLASRCDFPCVQSLKRLAPLEKQTNKGAILTVLSNCEKSCRAR